MADSRLGLRTRLIILVLIAITPFLLGAFIGLRFLERMEEENVRRELMDSAKLLSAHIEGHIKAARGLLAAGVVSPVVRSLSPESCSHHMREIVRQNPQFVDMGLVGRDGKLICDTMGRGRGIYVGDRPYIRKALGTGRFSISGYQVGRVSGRGAVSLAYPITGPAGATIGALVLSVNLAAVEHFLEGIPFSRCSTFTLLDPRGVILARVPEGEGWVGRDASGLDTVRAALSRREGEAAGPGLDGVRRLYAFAPLGGAAEESGIIARCGFSESEAFVEVRRLTLAGALGAAVLLFLVTLLTSFYGERSLLRPLRTLTEAARRLGKGDLDVLTGFKGKDEIGVLGQVIDRAAQSLGELTRQNRLIIENAHEGILFVDPEGKIVFSNPSAERMLGYGPGELTGLEMHLSVHHTKEDGSPFPKEECDLHGLLFSGGDPRSGETLFWRKEGGSFPVSYSYAPVVEGGWSAGAVAVFRDITEQRRLERQLLQSQKLEAMGRLAGGVAHDFNNFLTAIIGFSGFLRESLGPEDERRADVEEILKASQRAASLTRQLLLFSRNRPADLRVLSLSELVADQLKMLRRVVGEGVELREKLQAGVGPLFADPGQIEQVVLNLVVNARDAMPRGGVIELETGDAELAGDEEGMLLKGEPGPQVRLIVRDKGVGMDAKVIERLFEPFFTTKEAGRGTGLGLSIVYGVMRKHKGAIRVRSAPGQGSEFSLFFPREKGRAGAGAAPSPAPARRGTETVLVVENEDAIRSMIRRVLEKGGYRVLDAPGMREALELAGKAERAPELLLSDVVLPAARGPEVALKLRESLPGLKVLFITGFPGEQADLPQDPRLILHKPFSPQQLLERVRLILDENIA